MLDKFSRKEKYRQQEEKLKRQQEQLIKDGLRSKKEAEHRERLAVYELQRRERELAEEAAKLERKQEQARQKAAEREEEANRKKRDDWKRLTRELEIKEHEVKLLEEQVVGSNAARVS